MTRVLGADDLERELAKVRAEAAREDAGVFGPGSMTWRVDREAALFLGAGRALLLQLAHPWVAAGIAEHSSTLADPIGRFHRTFAVMFTMVFGGLDQALAAARHLHRRHARVTGTLSSAAGSFPEGSSYFANEASALQWVHATLLETALLMHDLVLPPLNAAQRESYYTEGRKLGEMFGLAMEAQPRDWPAFAAYNERMWRSDVLTVTPAAREIATRVLAGAGMWLHPPAWYLDVTAHLLPEPIRLGFNLPYGDSERRRAERVLSRIRRFYPHLPARLRTVGPYQEAIERLAGMPRPSLATRSLNRLWIGRPCLDPHPRSGDG